MTTKTLSAALAVLALAGACSDEGVPGSGPREPVSSVAVQPGTLTLNVGESRVLAATALAQDGTVLHGRPVQWSSGNDAVAQVSASGEVTARGVGSAVLAATVEGRRGEATITVRPVPQPVARVDVSPGEVVLQPGAARQLAVQVRADDGTELVGRTITWSSSDERVATVGASGRVEARRGGVAWITATSEGKSGQAKVVVPTWLEAPLRSVAGGALPAVLRSFKITDERGVELTRTLRVAAGRIRVNPGDQAYEQQFTVERWEQTYVILNGETVFTGVELKETRVVEDHGSVMPIHSGVETLVFRSGALSGHTFTGHRTEDGAYVTTQRIHAAGDPVLLRFAR